MFTFDNNRVPHHSFTGTAHRGSSLRFRGNIYIFNCPSCGHISVLLLIHVSYYQDTILLVHCPGNMMLIVCIQKWKQTKENRILIVLIIIGPGYTRLSHATFLWSHRDPLTVESEPSWDPIRLTSDLHAEVAWLATILNVSQAWAQYGK